YFVYRGFTATTQFFIDTDQHYIPQIGMGLLGILLATQSVIIASKWPDAITDGPQQPESQAMFDYLNQHTQPDDVIVFFKPRVMHLYTGRRSLIIEYMAKMEKGDYYVMHKYKGNYNQQLLYESEMNSYQFLNPVFENARFKVFKINHQEG